MSTYHRHFLRFSTWSTETQLGQFGDSVDERSRAGRRAARELAGLLEGSSFRVWPKYAATIHLFWPCTMHSATVSYLAASLASLILVILHAVARTFSGAKVCRKSKRKLYAQRVKKKKNKTKNRCHFLVVIRKSPLRTLYYIWIRSQPSAKILSRNFPRN